MNAKPDEPDLPARVVTRDRVVAAVEDALLTGQFVPGHAVSPCAGLPPSSASRRCRCARRSACFPPPSALDVMPNGRIRVPTMTRRRFDELLHARVLLEPHLAALALPNLSAAAGDLARIDDAIDESLVSGDVIAYMRRNHEFHFRIYRAAGRKSSCRWWNTSGCSSPPSCAPSTGGSARRLC